jgi:hypothetical protein
MKSHFWLRDGITKKFSKKKYRSYRGHEQPQYLANSEEISPLREHLNDKRKVQLIVMNLNVCITTTEAKLIGIS